VKSRLPGHSALLSCSVVLSMQGLQCAEPVESFYNGSSGGFGSTEGPNDRVTFPTLALAEGDATTSCPGSNFLNEPLAPDALISLFGNFTMNDTDGITSGLSFYYSSNGAFTGPTIDSYSWLNGTSTLLASMNPNVALTPFCTTTEQFCVWQADGATFSGTAESVVFKNVDYTAFDDLTLGSSTPGGVTTTPPVNTAPEPSSLLLCAAGLVGLLSFSRKFGEG